MFLKKAGGLLCLIFAFVFSNLAQDKSPIIEYGQPSELRGVVKIFVDSGFDVEQREQIARTIQKRLPDLQIVSRPDDAEVHLRYLGDNKDGEIIGTIFKVVGDNRLRVLYSFKETPQIFASDSYSGKALRQAKPGIFAAQFLGLYQKANSKN